MACKMFARFVCFVILVLFAGVSTRGECFFRCEENGACKPRSLICNGNRDCPHGSDESLTLCKDESLSSPDTFYCAYGAKINGYNKCNEVEECADKSDESPRLCQDENIFNLTKRGNCKDDQIECMPSECVPEDTMCNGRHDCSNGRDESVDLCMVICDDDHFQCGNGACLEEDLVCDNKFDCIDGSDELNAHCEGSETWKGKTPLSCVEPTKYNLKFSRNTQFHLENKTRHVYANEPVLFSCYDNGTKLYGNEWNVCTYTGEWLHNLPQCRSKPINYDLNTNGARGCPIDTYDRDRLLIRECNRGKCLKEVEPPINDKTVMFACKSGYTLLPTDLGEKIFECRKKVWDTKISTYTDPTCVKTCSPDRLYCSDSMKPSCQYNGEMVKCKQSGDRQLPGTIASYDCNIGYRPNTNIADKTLKCLDNGEWTHNPDMDEFCTLDCGIREIPQHSRSIHQRMAPWSVAIYMKQSSRYVYKCSGVRIRPNIALTAAHCVCVNATEETYPEELFRVGNAASDRQTVGSDYGWAVEFISHQFIVSAQTGDIALLQLKLNAFDEAPKIICLPYLPHRKVMPKLPVETVGTISSWDTSKNASMDLTSVPTITDVDISDKIRIKAPKGTKLCKGDSGSGFSRYCHSENDLDHNRICLYGVVSFSDRGVDNNTCSAEVAITNIIHYYNAEFIMDNIGYMTKTCSKK